MDCKYQKLVYLIIVVCSDKCGQCFANHSCSIADKFTLDTYQYLIGNIIKLRKIITYIWPFIIKEIQ